MTTRCSSLGCRFELDLITQEKKALLELERFIYWGGWLAGCCCCACLIGLGVHEQLKKITLTARQLDLSGCAVASRSCAVSSLLSQTMAVVVVVGRKPPPFPPHKTTRQTRQHNTTARQIRVLCGMAHCIDFEIKEYKSLDFCLTSTDSRPRISILMPPTSSVF